MIIFSCSLLLGTGGFRSLRTLGLGILTKISGAVALDACGVPGAETRVPPRSQTAIASCASLGLTIHKSRIPMFPMGSVWNDWNVIGMMIGMMASDTVTEP